MANTTRGALTNEIANELRRLTGGYQAWSVYHDHDGECRERLWAHVGSEPHGWSNLSGVDVLLGNADTREAVLVLEIEETACSPKKLLGDVCALALSEYVTTESDDQRYAITAKAELWVCFPVNPRGHQRKHSGDVLSLLQASWDGSFPLHVRLVTSDGRDTLLATVYGALQERFGR